MIVEFWIEEQGQDLLVLNKKAKAFFGMDFPEIDLQIGHCIWLRDFHKFLQKGMAFSSSKPDEDYEELENIDSLVKIVNITHEFNEQGYMKTITVKVV